MVGIGLADIGLVGIGLVGIGLVGISWSDIGRLDESLWNIGNKVWVLC